MSRKKTKNRVPSVPATVSFADEARRNLPADARAMIATVENDITIPYFTGALQNADDTLIQQGEGKGLAIYSEIERDPHAFAMLQKRKKRLLGRDWEVKPGGDQSIDQDAAEFVEGVLEALPFDRLCESLLDATLKGYAVAEVVWRRDGVRIVPALIKDMDQRRFVFDKDWKPRLLTWSDSRNGIELPDRKFIVHRFGAAGNNPYGLGLGNRLFWPVLFKREGINFWLYFLEKFAGPTIIGKTPYSNIPEEQQKLVQSLMRAQTASVITVPLGTEIGMLEASRGGTVSYADFIAYWDRQISIGVCGETLTTQVGDGGGSRALGEVHQDMLDALVDSDADLLSDTLRDQLLTWLVDFNFPGAAVPTVHRPRPENATAAATTRKAKAEAAKTSRDALWSVVSAAAVLSEDDDARDFILAHGVTDGLSDKTIDALVAARFDIAASAEPAPQTPTAPTANFATGDGLKKKRLTGDMSALPILTARSKQP